MQVPRVGEWLQSGKKSGVLQWFIAYLMALQIFNFTLYSISLGLFPIILLM